MVFESPVSPRVLYQLSLTGNMSGPYLRGEQSRRENKRSTWRDLQEVKEERAVKTLALKDGASERKRKQFVCLILKTDGDKLKY